MEKVKKARWTSVPEWVISKKHSKVMDGKNCLGLFLFLWFNADWNTGKLNMKYCTIVKKTGKTLRTTQRQMKILEQNKFIVIRRLSRSMVIEIPDYFNKSRSAIHGNSGVERTATHGAVIRHACHGDSPSATDHISDSKFITDSNLKKNKRSSAIDGGSIINSLSINSLSQRKRRETSPPNFNKFLSFAKQSRLKILDTTLIETSADKNKVRKLLETFPLSVVSIAWVLFLRSTDPYLVKNKMPKNIPVFCGQFSNLSEDAESIFNRSQRRYLKIKNEGLKRTVCRGDLYKWGVFLNSIESETLPGNFEDYIKPLKLQKIESSIVKIMCPNKTTKIILEQQYGVEFFQKHISNIFARNLQPEFIYDQKT
jgi:hypothetical protein